MANSAQLSEGLVLSGRARMQAGAAAWPAQALRFVRRKPLGAVGGVLVLALFVAGVFAPLIAPYGYDTRDYNALLVGISPAHLLGTDDAGRDMLSRIIYGARVSMIVGISAVLLSTVLATAVGVIAGYYGGLVDMISQRLVDVWIAFPAVLLLIVFAAMFGTPTSPLSLPLGLFTLKLQPADQRMYQIVLAIGVILAGGFSRVVRSAVLAMRANLYMEAARSLGSGTPRLIFRYVLPNIMPTIVVIATVQFGAVILIESIISFLGFGIPPPIPSWGQMLSGNAERFVNRAPLLAVWPGLAISLAVFGFNMLGDALRDVLDPRLRGG